MLKLLKIRIGFEVRRTAIGTFNLEIKQDAPPLGKSPLWPSRTDDRGLSAYRQHSFDANLARNFTGIYVYVWRITEACAILASGFIEET
jgi:hypothetical protein